MSHNNVWTPEFEAQQAEFRKLYNEQQRLRIAGPEMLAALKDIQSQCSGHADEFSRRVWVIADQAIAKAEGR